MRPRLLLVLACVTASLAAQPLRAEDTPQSCDVPDNLLATDSALPKTADAIKAGKLDLLAIGTRSSTIVSADSSAYPARLQAAMQAAVPKLSVNLSVEIQGKKTANEAAPTFAKVMEARKPTLVIWQTGTVDAMRGVDPDDFRSAVDEGVVALQKAGTDVVLINPQYSPRTETMISVPPYIDNMRAVAQGHDVPLFDRFGIMHQWNDQGDFDLFSTTHGIDLAKRVHDCLGRALSKFIIDAAHQSPAQQN